MFGRFFGATYFGPSYWGPGVTVTPTTRFADEYFPLEFDGRSILCDGNLPIVMEIPGTLVLSHDTSYTLESDEVDELS